MKPGSCGEVQHCAHQLYLHFSSACLEAALSLAKERLWTGVTPCMRLPEVIHEAVSCPFRNVSKSTSPV